MMANQKTYIAIDLKSFYASAEEKCKDFWWNECT